MDEPWRGIAETERPFTIAPSLNGHHVHAINPKINRTLSGLGIKMFRVAGSANRGIHGWRPEAAGQDDGLASKSGTYTLQEGRKLGGSIDLMLC